MTEQLQTCSTNNCLDYFAGHVLVHEQLPMLYVTDTLRDIRADFRPASISGNSAKAVSKEQNEQ